MPMFTTSGTIKINDSGVSISAGTVTSYNPGTYDPSTITTSAIGHASISDCCISSAKIANNTYPAFMIEKTTEEKIEKLLEDGIFEEDENFDYVIGYVATSLKNKISNWNDDLKLESRKIYCNVALQVGTEKAMIMSGRSISNSSGTFQITTAKMLYADANFKVFEVRFKKDNIKAIYGECITVSEVEVGPEIDLFGSISFSVSSVSHSSNNEKYYITVALINSVTGVSYSISIVNDSPDIDEELLVEKINTEIEILLKMERTKEIKGQL